MTRRTLTLSSLRTVVVLLALAVGATQAFGLWQDARDLASIATSLEARQGGLDANLVRAVGGVLEQLGLRARVHTALAVLMVGAAALSLVVAAGDRSASSSRRA